MCKSAKRLKLLGLINGSLVQLLLLYYTGTCPSFALAEDPLLGEMGTDKESGMEYIDQSYYARSADEADLSLDAATLQTVICSKQQNNSNQDPLPKFPESDKTFRTKKECEKEKTEFAARCDSCVVAKRNTTCYKSSGGGSQPVTSGDCSRKSCGPNSSDSLTCQEAWVGERKDYILTGNCTSATVNCF